MARHSRQNPAIREFVLRNLAAHPRDITQVTATKFGLSRAASVGYLRRLQTEGLVKAAGRTKGRSYSLMPTIEEVFQIEISPDLPEDIVFRHRVLPHMSGLKPNLIALCQYGFTEILNNAIDHSGSENAVVIFRRDYAQISMTVIDFGIGIFQKLQNDFGLADPRTALLELSKGKLTSDRQRHAGEGIFYTSRMFDQFSVGSGELFYTRRRKNDDEWLIEAKTRDSPTQGTSANMTLSTDAEWTPQQVFAKYQKDDLVFRRTHVPLNLGRYPGEELVSRSQAKRVLARFEQFSEVILDFDGVKTIGQAFADEIFRVFQNDHPKTPIHAINTSKAIRQMIQHVRRGQTMSTS